jgi:hypothetical protein
MPNKKESFFADLLKQLEQEKITRGRPVEQIEEKRYFLIVCEGIRTEPIYFNYFKKFLPNHLLETIEVSGQGDNTINIVDIAIKKRAEREKNLLLPPFDEVWAVFDKDDFPADRYDNAVVKAQEFGIEAGISNEAFELWYILHFQLLTNALKRQQYIGILSKILGFKYEKNKQNSEKVVELLFEKGNVRNAIQWAEMLEQMHVGNTPSKSCPYTRVYILVKRLLKYTKIKY